MNRRDMLKLGAAGSLAAVASVTRAAAQSPDRSPTAHPAVPRWDVFELVLAGPSTGNPFVDVQLTAVFTLGQRTVSVDGFYDGGGTYRLRFMPDTEGEWSYATRSNAVSLQASGRFACIAPLPGSHGPVKVRDIRHFEYADGTPYFPFGTTCYAWVHQRDDVQRRTLETLRTAPFNKIRMCVFPKSYEYNHNEPPLYPFERNAAGASDFSRPNPAYFVHLEQRIADLRALGIEADLILFHPYDRWGYATMPAEADDRYLRYVVARWSAYRNVWWSLANEWDLMKAKSAADFDRLFQIVTQHDAAGHLRSIHYSRAMYDYSRPWVTHASLQTTDFSAAGGWFEAWRKPICFDEVQYEGNLNRRWGNLSGEEMVRRVWLGVIAGGYVTHGETYLDPNEPFDQNTTPTLWWSHGGRLRGSSPARIAFLRNLIEETGATTGRRPVRSGLNAPSSAYYLNASRLDATGRLVEVVLYYFDFHQPIYYEFPLPEGQFTAELIDPWEMTIRAVPGVVSGNTKLKLTGRPYQAVRFRRVP